MNPADILTRSSIDFLCQLYEVKATTYRSVDAPSKKEFSRDRAIQAWVLKQCQIDLNGMFLMHLNHECIFPEMNNLFEVIDYASEVKSILEDIDGDIQRLQNVLLSKQYPNIGIGQYCEKPRECQFMGCNRDLMQHELTQTEGILVKWHTWLHLKKMVHVAEKESAQKRLIALKT